MRFCIDYPNSETRFLPMPKLVVETLDALSGTQYLYQVIGELKWIIRLAKTQRLSLIMVFTNSQLCLLDLQVLEQVLLG